MTAGMQKPEQCREKFPRTAITLSAEAARKLPGRAEMPPAQGRKSGQNRMDVRAADDLVNRRYATARRERALVRPIL